MPDQDNFGSFFRENRQMLKDYLETRTEIFRLRAIRFAAKVAGALIWILISLFLVLLLFTFAGLVIGFWLSEITGSYVWGFGITTLIIAGLIILLALFRHQLFVHPIIRAIIRQADEESRVTED